MSHFTDGTPEPSNEAVGDVKWRNWQAYMEKTARENWTESYL